MIWTNKTTRNAAICFAAATLLAVPAGAGETDAAAVVQATAETMTAQFMAGDIDGVLTAYEAGAVVVFEPGSPASGREILRAAFTQFAAVEPEFTYAGHQVVVAGDIAIHIAPWEMTGTLPDGQAVSDNGLSVAVMRRQVDGSWKMVIDNPYGDRF